MEWPHKRLARWRADRKLTYRQAGEILGCSGSYLKQIEDGPGDGHWRTPGRTIANRLQRETADWQDGPIRSAEWDDAIELWGQR